MGGDPGDGLPAGGRVGGPEEFGTFGGATATGGNGESDDLLKVTAGNAVGAVMVLPQLGHGPETPARELGTTRLVPQLWHWKLSSEIGAFGAPDASVGFRDICYVNLVN